LSRLVIVLVLLVLVIGVPTAGRVSADSGLQRAIATTWFPRYDDADLHAIAHERVSELAACECLDHEGMRSGTAEVIAFNQGYPDALARVVSQWRTSADHNAILSNRSYGRIGCAEVVSDDVHWVACVLGFGDLPPAPAPLLLPNTALPANR
jgi:hypothetical protein